LDGTPDSPDAPNAPDAPDREARWRRADRLLDAALDLPAEERLAFVRAECAGDDELLELVQRLLSNLDTRTSFMHEAVVAPDWVEIGESADETSELAGKKIGRYRVIEEIGRGGMAVVYLAERADGEFEQRVALKLIKRGTDTDEVIRRFERERQIMARAGHPNMARLLDGGATENGQPYFVMEYVDGLPIDRYCDERRLDVRERVRLFLRVLDAVAYAHRNLVVHRDIKPSNILVTSEGEVKLLDFGIAKLLESDDDAVTLTRTGQVVMTPAFASPEQIRGRGITTATDIYQLGVLLCSLVSGRLPYRASIGDAEGLRREILEQEPTRPSTLIRARDAPTVTGAPATSESLGRARSVTPTQLRRELAGDVDNIVLKALRKEPGRRYPTVAQLGDDLQRWLDGMPVSARPDTLGYRATKFVRRHRLGVGLGAAILTLLLAFAVTMTFQAARIARERDRANREAATTERVSDFLVGLFELADPGESRGETVTVREVLDDGARRVGEELSDEPEVQARLMDTIGRVYQNLGLYDSAAPLIEEALELRRATLDPRSDELAESVNNAAWLLEQRGDYAAAEPLYREALELRRAIHGEPHAAVASSLNNLGLLLYRKGDSAAARSLMEQSLTMRRSLAEPDDVETADTLMNLGLVHQQDGELDAAQERYGEALAILRTVLGGDHPKIAIGLDNLSRVSFARQDYETAERLVREGLEMRRRLFGEEHPQISESLNNLASTMYRAGDRAGAEEVFRQVVALDRKLLGPDHPDLAYGLNNLGSLLQRRGDHAGAEPLFREAAEIWEATLGEQHWLVALARANLGDSLAAMERFDEAEPLLLAAYGAAESSLGTEHERTRGMARRLARLYEAWGRSAEADRFERLAGPAEGASGGG
jgi:serine/threonine-protein kinase